MIYNEVLDSTEQLFQAKISSWNFPIKWKIVHANLKPKKDGSIAELTIVSPKLKNITDYDFLIVINDNIFGRLSDDLQHVVADKLLAKVNFDFENDALKSATPDFVEFTGVLEKHGYAEVTSAISEIRRIYSEIKEETASSDGSEQL